MSNFPKKLRIGALACAMAVALVAAGCRAAPTDTTNAAQQSGQVRGIVSAVSTDSITIAVIPTMEGGQFSGRPQGSFQPDGSFPPGGFRRGNGQGTDQGNVQNGGQGDALPDGSAAPDGAQGNAQGGGQWRSGQGFTGGQFDTSKLEQKTYKIDAGTKIVRGTSTVAAGDIKSGDMVRIDANGDTATRITLTEGFGGPRATGTAGTTDEGGKT